MMMDASFGLLTRSVMEAIRTLPTKPPMPHVHNRVYYSKYFRSFYYPSLAGHRCKAQVLIPLPKGRPSPNKSAFKVLDNGNFS